MFFLLEPCCSCLFCIRALVALVTGLCGDTVSAMPVTKKYYLLYFEYSVLVLGTCCCFLVFCRCLLVVHSDPNGHLGSGLGGFGLPSAARQEAEFGCRWQLFIVHPATSGCNSHRPARHFTFTVMDQLVSRVTDEVTKRLQPLLSNLSSLAQQTQSPPLHHLKHLPCHSLWNSPLCYSLVDPTSNKPKDMLPSKIQSRYLLFTMASSQS